MIVFVYGGSGSGKSSFAEKCLSSFGDDRLYYIATMKVYDAEGQAKIQRHRRLREGKGFITIEQPADMALAARKLGRRSEGPADKGLRQPVRSLEKKPLSGEAVGRSLSGCCRTEKCAVLLECVTNLVANEMFTEEGTLEESLVVDKIEEGLEALFSAADDLVLVSGNVFGDGYEYSQSTLAYMRALGRVNSYIASRSDEAYELVAGIPLPLLGQVK